MRSHVWAVRHEMDAGGIFARVLARIPVLLEESLAASAGRGGPVAALTGEPNGERSCAGRVTPAAEARP
jgi:hypothetical protein